MQIPPPVPCAARSRAKPRLSKPAPPLYRGRCTTSPSGARLAEPSESDDLRASMAPDELRRAMASLGYRTQSELADAIGVSRSAVSLWLEGKVGVPRPVAMLLRMLIAARRRNY